MAYGVILKHLEVDKIKRGADGLFGGKEGRGTLTFHTTSYLRRGNENTGPTKPIILSNARRSSHNLQNYEWYYSNYHRDYF
jgi:hypothetical protein